MEKFVKRTWAKVDVDNIKHNFNEIKKRLNPKTKLLCVLKADAYGHGAEFLVGEYEKLGADFFGVSNLDEAMQLRKAGAKKPILIFGYTPSECADILADNNISQAVFSLEYAKKLQKQCKNKGVKVKAHLKIDTGMSRIGFFAQDEESRNRSVDEILEISGMPEIEIEGMFTHFSVADDVTNNKEYTLNQIDNFKDIIKILEAKGLYIPLKHCCNSGALINFHDMQLDMVRAGVILYGLYPSDEIVGKIDLKPAMSLKTVVSQVKTIPKGTSVSYGRTFVSDREIKVASVAIGYADGYSIKFSNNSEMLVHGKRAKILGRVCMDQLMLDVSDIEGVAEGDEVIVFGGDGENNISVDELAKNIGTINYEIICLIGKR
ncbi:MAG: alanine racemase, partial [Clostridia bacterium]|nr:alanine racemase [Clostridia bacterium]MBR2735522.1 alanine racemase [Clostridia bacterium]